MSKATVKDMKSGAVVDAIEAPAYSKNPEFIGQAFTLFCKGYSYERMADFLRPDWPEVASRTIARIGAEMGWEKHRASFMANYMEAMARGEKLVPDVIMQLEKLRMQLESMGRMDIKEIYAYRQLCEDLMWYTGKHPKLKDAAPLAVSGDEELEALLSAIAEDDVVGPAWKRRRGKIDAAYRAKLKEAKKRAPAVRGKAKAAKG